MKNSRLLTAASLGGTLRVAAPAAAILVARTMPHDSSRAKAWHSASRAQYVQK